MIKSLSLAGLVASLALSASSLTSQLPNCAGVGDAVLNFELTNNEPLGAGSAGKITLIGDPGVCYWLICDTEKGLGTVSHPLFGSGDMCVPMNPGYFNLDVCFSPTGVDQFPFTIPYGFTDEIMLCCQWLGIHSTTFEITISNVVCMCANTGKCEAVNGLSYSTKFAQPASFPVNITSSWDGSGQDTVSVSYDPASPPTFPITQGALSIEKIILMNGEVLVFSRIDAGKDPNGGLNELDNQTDVKVQMDAITHSESIHTSCSQPLSGGMTFGDFLLHEVVETLPCGAAKCEGGVNCLGYTTSVDAPASYPVTVMSRFSETNLSNAESVSVSFDPNNPPTFPVISANGQIAIEGIDVVGNELVVRSFADRGKDANGNRLKFSDNNILFHTSAGASVSEQVIHMSCSKPIGPGIVYGKYEITRFCSVKDGTCDGGINILGLVTDVDAPASYPVTVTASVTGKNTSDVSVSFDPNSPPIFPIVNAAGDVIIDSIKAVNGKLQVVMFADNGRDNKGKRRKFDESDTTFEVSHAGDSNKEVIHVSCSQPIGPGSVFGDFKVIRMVSKN